jgi:hypothetical protein
MSSATAKQSKKASKKKSEPIETTENKKQKQKKPKAPAAAALDKAAVQQRGEALIRAYFAANCAPTADLQLLASIVTDDVRRVPLRHVCRQTGLFGARRRDL